MKAKIEQVLGKGVYTISDAHRLTGITWPRVRHWIRGDLRNPRGNRTPMPPIIDTEFDRTSGIYLLSFLDLIEIMMIDRFRKNGVSIRATRLAHERAKILFKTSHPFALQKFWTDGRDILTYIGEEANEKALINLRRNQFELDEITQLFITKIDISESGLSLRWWPMDRLHHIVIDPERSFGQPITAVEGVQTLILANAVKAEKSIERAAEWHDVDPKAVQDAYKYEVEFTGRIAA